MTQLSYDEIQRHLLDGGFVHQVCAGDLVRTGPNLYPHFWVMAVDDGTAWVRNTDTGADGLVPVERCQLLGRSR